MQNQTFLYWQEGLDLSPRYFQNVFFPKEQLARVASEYCGNDSNIGVVVSGIDQGSELIYSPEIYTHPQV